MASHNNSIAKRTAFLGLLTAIALIFGYLEFLLPPLLPIPGVKLGLANLVIMSCIYLCPLSQVIMVLIAKVLLSGLLFGNAASMIYSLAGALFSFVMMRLAKKSLVFSEVGVSVIGGVSHNLAQLSMAAVLLRSKVLIGYLPLLLLAGVLAGLLIGLLAKIIRPRLYGLI